MLNVTDSTFTEEVLDFGGTVFVDFWAPWCVPCKVMLPIYEKLADTHTSESVKFVKYEAGAEDCTQALKEYGISGIPTFIAFRSSRDPIKFVGAGDLEGFINRTLTSND